MTTTSWDRSRRAAAAASALTMIAVVAFVIALGGGVPDAWWPHTGQAFAADARTGHPDACASIVGPAKAYCERGTTAAAGRQDTAGAVWRLVPVAAGVAAVVVWRLRAPGQKRR
ncbi:hypothetical protein [Streptomyces antibioticus]|uniref:hypothetical protein n=1 Tax=Streptomyces antibioticus TaxID=1890 RepID=UPI00225923D9|nr:hypothetical protein [Streptomyces antibioticus]MCX4740829.1 hypothetical protein [Streptomyces antibioticus]